MATLNVTNLQNVASSVTNVSLLADGTTSLVLNSTGTARTGGIRYNGGNLELYTGASWVPVAVGNFLPLAGGTMTGAITFAGGQTFPGTLPLAGGTMTGNLIPAATGQSGYWSRTGTTLAPATATDSVQVAAGTAAAPSLNFSGSATTGLFSPGANRIGVANNGVQTVEVTASGNVLIGGTLPGTPNISLNADGSSNFVGRNITLGSFNGASIFRAQNLDGNVNSNAINAVTASTGNLILDGGYDIGSGYNQTIIIRGNGDVLIGGTLPASPNITLQSGGSISSSATSNPSSNGLVFDPGDGGTANTPQLIIRSASGSNPNVAFSVQNGAVGQVQLDLGGNVRAVNTAGIQPIVSERRFKQNIKNLDIARCWEDTKRIPWRTFEYRSNPGTTYTGHIVDEVEAVDPSLIVRSTLENEDALSYDNATLSAMRMVALQEALKRIEALEAEVASLKGA